MFGFVLSLAVLSVMFTLISGAAFLYRKTFLKGREGYMYPLWIFVLVLSVMPFRFDLPVSPDNIPRESTLPAAEEEIAVSSPQNGTEDSGRITVIRPGRHTSPGVLLRRALSVLVSKCGLIANVIFVIWLAGATTRFTFSVNDYRQAKKLLLCSSFVCKDKKLIRMLNDCERDLGMKRRIRLRMIESDGLCSPCVCGLFAPVLYLEPGCLSLSDTELRCVIAHELTHIRRNDMLLKLFTLFVTSVHWFNPASGRVLKYVYEDCELACDNNVIRTYGNSISGDYMTAILDFAERFSERRRLIGSENFDGGFFFAKTSNAAFLKRRYANMKNFRKCHTTLAVTAAIAITMGAANLFALSSCGSLNPGSFQNSLGLSEPVEMMLRAYFGLSEDDFITVDMLDKVTTLTISANKTVEGHVLADFVVNGEAGYAQAVPTLALANYWDTCVAPKVDEAVAKADETSYYNEEGKLIRAVFGDKINAFYCLKDPYDHTLTERALEEMNLTYPVIREKGSLYIFDPYSSDREIQAIYQCFDKAGLLDPWMVDSDVFDASFLEYFPNLTEVTFVGFKPVNYDFPAEITVSEEEYDASKIFDVYRELQDKYATNPDTPAFATPMTVSYRVPTDGSEIVIPKNRSLEYALREYFALENWDRTESPLTTKHTAGITSIKAELRTDEIGYFYKEQDPELFRFVSYVKYTINGTELPLIPLNYAKTDYENLFGGVVDDEKAQELLKKYYTLSEDGTRYTLGEIPEEDEIYLFKCFAVRDCLKAAVIGDYESPAGVWKFEFQSPSSALGGTPARFIDWAGAFDDSDKELFQSLVEWDTDFKAQAEAKTQNSDA